MLHMKWRPQWKNGITSIWTDFEVLVPFVSFTCLEQAREISSRNLSFLNSSATFSARDVTDENMASSTPGAEESRCGRKRLRYEDDWKRKKRKLQKDKGESYRTYKGEERAEKQLVDLTCVCIAAAKKWTRLSGRDSRISINLEALMFKISTCMVWFVGRMSGDEREQQNLDPTLLATTCVCGMAVTCRCAKPVFALCMQLGNAESKI